MIAAYLLALLQLPSPVRARLEVDPAAVDLGQPARVSLVVEHPSAVRVRLADPGLVPGDAWVLFDEGGPSTRPAPGEDGQSETRWTWSLAALEPGTPALPEVSVEYDWAGVPRRLVAETAQVEVHGLLADGETGPRPPRGFREVPEPPPPPARTAARVALVVALLAALSWFARRWLARRRRRALAAPPEPPPAEVLAGLSEPEPGDHEAAARLHDQIARELRRVGAQLLADELAAGWTSAEWVRALEAKGCVAESSRLSELAELLDACDRARFGFETPTPFALRERLERARELAQTLAGSPAPGAEPARAERALASTGRGGGES